MSILDRIPGRDPESTGGGGAQANLRPAAGYAAGAVSAGQPADAAAVERYRHLLRNAPPEAIEQARAEAFAQLTPQQRRLVLEGLNGELQPQERANRDDPQSLARVATRAELRRPGSLERTFGNAGVGPGSILAIDLLSTIAGVVIGTAIADAIFADGSVEEYQDRPEPDDAGEVFGSDASDPGFAAGDLGGDFGGVEFGGGEF